MTTAIIPFAPSLTDNFQFQATFDGVSYSLVVLWSLYSKRWYIACNTLQGQLVYMVPLIGSPDNYDISLNIGYFDTPMIYRVSTNQFEIG